MLCPLCHHWGGTIWLPWGGHSSFRGQVIAFIYSEVCRGRLAMCQGGFRLLPQRCLPSPAVPAGTRHNFRRMTQVEEKLTRQKKKKSRIIEASDWCHFCVHKRCHSEVFLTLFPFAALWWLYRISKEISIFWRDLWSWFSFVFLYLKTLHADPIKAQRPLCWKMRDLMSAKGLQLFRHWARFKIG